VSISSGSRFSDCSKAAAMWRARSASIIPQA
jgi:hypothetical protein